MRSKLSIVALFVAVGLLLTVPGFRPGRAGAAAASSSEGRIEGDGCAGSRPHAWLHEPVSEPTAPPLRSETDGPAPPAEPPRSCNRRDLRRAGARCALVAGELPAGQAFLRVNGSADAHGARA